MRIWLVEILVRLGVAVIADGRCRPRWYGSDQERKVKSLGRYWWSAERRRSVASGHFDVQYYVARMLATGSNHGWRQYLSARNVA